MELTGLGLHTFDSIQNFLKADLSLSNSNEYFLQVDCVLKLWKNGFSVDDGPLRDFKDPANKEFLASISKG